MTKSFFMFNEERREELPEGERTIVGVIFLEDKVYPIRVEDGIKWDKPLPANKFGARFSAEVDAEKMKKELIKEYL